jgi:glycolate oxidase FAD binding subunit
VSDNAQLDRLIEQVRSAASAGTRLRIEAGKTKTFYGNPVDHAAPLDVTGFDGIISYEPTELVVTARCGTPLAELEATLAEQGQCLPFEPPHFAGGKVVGGTVGGMVAAGLSGPARAAVGAVRDYMLGATLLNGQAEVLTFGGQVMKNVAGYDVSRLLAGSLGTLGVILDVSLKVLPAAPATATLRFEMDEATAIQRLNEWGGRPLPINASAWWDGTLVLRLRGAAAAVDAAVRSLGGELIPEPHAGDFWRGLRNQSDEFFVKARAAVDAGGSLWRLSLPSTTVPLQLSGEQLIEWGGAQRWVCTTTPAAVLRETARLHGGHATRFHGRPQPEGCFAPLAPPLDRIHRELKRAFDPAGIFNPGRLYPDL